MELEKQRKLIKMVKRKMKKMEGKSVCVIALGLEDTSLEVF